MGSGLPQPHHLDQMVRLLRRGGRERSLTGEPRFAGRWDFSDQPIVAQTWVHYPAVLVCTVGLNADSDTSDDEPRGFETVIFGGPCNEWCWRYSTWDQANAGHWRVVEALLERREPQ